MQKLLNWIIICSLLISESIWGTKKYNISFQNSLHNIFDSKLFEEQIALGLILELEAIWPLIIFKGCPKFSFHWKWLKERWRHFYLAVILLVIISKGWFIMVVGDLLTSFHLIQKLLMDRWRHFGWAVMWLAIISKGWFENDCWRLVNKYKFDSDRWRHFSSEVI